MNIMDLLLSRRSIRKYSDRQVTDVQVDHLIQAAMHAPSAGNQQPWHFVVLRDKAVFEKIVAIHPHSKMLPSASVAILVCGDPTLETKIDYWTIDCSTASQNILIAAHGLELGAVWLGVYPRPERMEGIKNILKLPSQVIPFSLIAIGYPAEEKPMANDRYKPERIHYGKW